MDTHTQKLFPFLIFVFFSTATLFSQTIYVSGDIISNTAWNVDTVKIIGDVTVVPGIVLTVNPGTYVESQGYYKVNVSGVLRAIGTEADPVTFTVNDTTNFWTDTTSVAGGWAGIRINSTNASTDSSVFEYCRIQFAKKYDVYGGDIMGGAIFALNYGTLIIKNSLLNSNVVICDQNGVDGAQGGAVYCRNVDHVLIQNNRFENNRSFSHGGAIHIAIQCQALITENTFIRNRAIYWRHMGGYLVTGGVGAAISTSDNGAYSPTICNNYCFNNQSVNGMIYTSNWHSLIFNNLICNNHGSGIVDGHQLSTSRIFNNTIVNNTASNGGITLFSRAIVYNNICWGNVRFHGYEDAQIWADPNLAYPQLFYNCVQFGNGGEYSINESPEFTDPSSGIGPSYDGSRADWTLMDSSPCINRGTVDTAGLLIPDLDIAGNPRIYGVHIEMGSYENQNVFVGVPEPNISEHHLSVYPNPGTSQLNIESDQSETDFELYNESGQIIIHKQINPGTLSINTESLTPGIYFYRLVSDKNMIQESGKWIKKAR